MTNELVNSSIEEETHQVMNNLIGVAEAAGTSLSNTIKTSVFLTDMSLFYRFDKILG